MQTPLRPLTLQATVLANLRQPTRHRTVRAKPQDSQGNLRGVQPTSDRSSCPSGLGSQMSGTQAPDPPRPAAARTLSSSRRVRAPREVGCRLESPSCTRWLDDETTVALAPHRPYR